MRNIIVLPSTPQRASFGNWLAWFLPSHGALVHYRRPTLRHYAQLAYSAFFLTVFSVFLGVISDAKAAPNPHGNIFRLQLSVMTDESTNGVDGSIVVRLNDNNRTRIDSPVDDFDGGHSFTYDLLIDGINTFDDIERIQIDHELYGLWCFSRIFLYANDTLLFHRYYNPARCMQGRRAGLFGTVRDEPATVVFDREEVRSNDAWINYDGPEQLDFLFRL